MMCVMYNGHGHCFVFVRLQSVADTRTQYVQRQVVMDRRFDIIIIYVEIIKIPNGEKAQSPLFKNQPVLRQIQVVPRPLPHTKNELHSKRYNSIGYYILVHCTAVMEKYSAVPQPKRFFILFFFIPSLHCRYHRP